MYLNNVNRVKAFNKYKLYNLIIKLLSIYKRNKWLKANANFLIFEINNFEHF